MIKTLDEFEQKVKQWSHDRGILTNGKDTTQALKLVSEIGELCDNIAKGADCRDDIGDCLVVLTNIAALRGYTLLECGNIAYDDIKDRKGFLNEHGNFIKSTDPKYEQLLMDFENSQTPEVTVTAFQQLDLFSNPYATPNDFMLTLSDGTTYDINITEQFMAAYPNPPLGKPLNFWIAENSRLKGN